MYGRGRCEKILGYLGRLNPKYQALASPVGKEIFDDAMRLFDGLFEKGVTEGLTDDERAEYKVLRELLGRWCDIILRYEKTQTKIIGGE